MKKMISYLISAVICLVVMAPMASSSVADIGEPSEKLPTSHMIENVPFHKQLTGVLCGAGSLEMVFDYWGPDIDQKEVADVARTSSSGTYTYDIVRTGHFSYLSSAMGYYFPHDAPEAGFTERAIGYASFGYSSDEFWLDELKTLIANDIPVIVLMNYYPDGGGGHYRVVIGYDDIAGEVWFIDTWGRDIMRPSGFTGIISWSYEDFQSGWNYAEYGTEHPYFGAIIMPWTVEVSVLGNAKPGSSITVNADITYPCPWFVDSSLFPASDAIASISLPEGFTLKSGSAEASLGDMSAGSSASVTWKVKCGSTVSGESISVSAGGIVYGSVPDAQWAGNKNYYPAYDYMDMIGGEATVLL
ncbi:MAG TPA: hypothetical protein ENN25_01190 [Euryarchaeota archaeon]|nr:hypothetical protein [Euryarchaeota archaeon]